MNAWTCRLAFILVLLTIANVTEGQMIVGHRGAAYDAPENTIASFNLAWQQGADGIEGDFYLTADKQVVCIHDADTQRIAGVRHVVEQTSLELLRTLDVGGWKGRAYRGEKIPTLAEVLATVPAGKRMVIELKSGPEIVPFLTKEIERTSPPRDSLLIIAFDDKTIADCKQFMPDIRAHWLTGFKTDPAGETTPAAATICQVVQECGADGVGMAGDRRTIDRKFIDTLQAGGCREFHVWTIDDIADAEYFDSLGAIGITTNRPGFILAGLAEPKH